jgi:hypothetical protein
MQSCRGATPRLTTRHTNAGMRRSVIYISFSVTHILPPARISLFTHRVFAPTELVLGGDGPRCGAHSRAPAIAEPLTCFRLGLTNGRRRRHLRHSRSPWVRSFGKGPTTRCVVSPGFITGSCMADQRRPQCRDSRVGRTDIFVGVAECVRLCGGLIADIWSPNKHTHIHIYRIYYGGAYWDSIPAYACRIALSTVYLHGHQCWPANTRIEVAAENAQMCVPKPIHIHPGPCHPHLSLTAAAHNQRCLPSLRLHHPLAGVHQL